LKTSNLTSTIVHEEKVQMPINRKKTDACGFLELARPNMEYYQERVTRTPCSEVLSDRQFEAKAEGCCVA
jgi:hypothetical protein